MIGLGGMRAIDWVGSDESYGSGWVGRDLRVGLGAMRAKDWVGIGKEEKYGSWVFKDQNY